MRERVAGRARVALADAGVVCALGSSLDAIWPRLVAGDQSRFTQRDDLVPGGARPFGEVQEELPAIAPELAAYECRNNRLALAALDAIRPSLATALARFGPERIGIVVGSSTAGISEAEHALRERAATGRLPARFDLAQLEFGGLSEFLALASGARGPCYAVSTACSSGAKALVSARSLLEIGICDAVIAGAVDSSCRLTSGGFDALQALARGLTNPMSRNRDGITLGEAAVLFLVTRDEGGVQLLGAGESSDAHHMAAPDPEGRGAEACMRAALVDADLGPDAISYLNLHGSGTPHNDAMESWAVTRVLGPGMPCSSSKPLVGHTLGASGALELAFCWAALQRRDGRWLALPPHRWDGEEDPGLPRLDLVASHTWIEATGPVALMSNSFGFGGSNCALVVGDARR
jgi:3-oxoacyl-[acyl-carrier-protein] synthase-1